MSTCSPPRLHSLMPKPEILAEVGELIRMVRLQSAECGIWTQHVSQVPTISSTHPSVGEVPEPLGHPREDLEHGLLPEAAVAAVLRRPLGLVLQCAAVQQLLLQARPRRLHHHRHQLSLLAQTHLQTPV